MVKDFAESIGVSLQNLNVFTARKTDAPPSKFIVKVRDKYNINPNYFFDNSAPMFLVEGDVEPLSEKEAF